MQFHYYDVYTFMWQYYRQRDTSIASRLHILGVQAKTLVAARLSVRKSAIYSQKSICKELIIAIVIEAFKRRTAK